MFGGRPYFPGPWEPIQTILIFFQDRPAAVVLCVFLQFGSIIPFGIFVASTVSRLRFLGVKAAGVEIALFGGLATACLMMANAAVLWTMTRPAISHDAVVTEALYYIGYGMGGPGFSVPLGIFMAGVSVPVYFRRLVPRWIAIVGLVLAVCGELSWLNIEFPQALFLIPLTRFPGFLWMIAFGFALPKSLQKPASGGAQ
jgi:hypothetical protein